jgi:hypothetical protein
MFRHDSPEEAAFRTEVRSAAATTDIAELMLAACLP